MSRRTTALAVGAALVATASTATLAACGNTHHHVVVTSQPAAVSYAPAAYGQNGQCYYLDDPQEALSLIAAGLCQPGWRPTLMPLYWHQEYYSYYASDAYMDAYVPRSYWGSYHTQQNNFYTVNKTTIINVQKNAVYKGSNGATVAASALPSSKLSFGAGVKPSMSFGSVAPPKPDNSAPSAKISFGGGASAKPSFGSSYKPPASAPKPPPVVPR